MPVPRAVYLNAQGPTDSLQYGPLVPALTGDPADDSVAISAGTGQKLAGLASSLAAGSPISGVAASSVLVADSSSRLQTGVAVGSLLSASGSGQGRTQVLAPAGAGLRDWVSVKDAPFNAVMDGVTDDGPALRAAIAGVGTNGTVFIPAGTLYVNTAGVAAAATIPRNATHWRLQGAGMYATTIKLSANTPRLTDLGKVADGDSISNWDIWDLTVDVNNVGGRHHVVAGTYQAGVQQTKVSINNWSIRRVRTINVPTDPTTTDHRLNVFLVPVVNAADAAATINDGLVEDCDFTHGGNIGVTVGGTASSAVNGIGNLSWDNINIVRVKHDTGVPATSGTYASENIQIGSQDTGGTCSIRDCTGSNAGDVGIAILNCARGVVEGCTVTDARNAAFQAINFWTLAPTRQRNTFRDCHALIVNLTPVSSYYATGFAVGEGSATGAFNGTIEILDSDCTSTSASLGPFGQALAMGNTYVAALIVRNFCFCQETVSQTLSGAINTAGIALSPLAGATTLTLENCRSHVTGSVSRAGFAFSYTDVAIMPQVNADVTLNVTHYPRISLSGLAANSTFGARIGPNAIPATVNVTGNTSTSAATVTGLSATDMAQVTPGDTVVSTGNMPANQTVRTVNVSAGSFTYGPNATGSADTTGATVTVTPLCCVRGSYFMDWQGDESGDTGPYGVYVMKWQTPGKAPVASTYMGLSHLSCDGSNFSRMPAGSAGNGNTILCEVVDTGNAANNVPLVTYHRVRSANGLGHAAASSFNLANGATTVPNQFGRRYLIMPLVTVTGLTFARGLDVSATTITATSGPFQLDPGDSLAITSTGANPGYWRIPVDV